MRTTMRGLSSGDFIHRLERLFQHGTTGGLTEGELLDRFVRAQDEAAFEAIIARHGPMVLGVCRQLLRDPNDVDDAFQATFLVLVRKAGTLRRSDLLGNWLHGVAHRVATRARVTAARRSARAPFGTDAIAHHEPGEDSSMDLEPEPIPWLHEEVRRLPERYRVPVLLCYFEGLTHEQAASRLGWPIGSVKGRLSRARDLLRRRLTRRGVALSAPALASSLGLADARAIVPESLRSATLRAAGSVARMTGRSVLTATSVSLPVASLTHGVLRAMITTPLKAVSLVLLVAGAVTTGLVLASAQEPAPAEPEEVATVEKRPEPAQQKQAEPAPAEAKSKAARRKAAASRKAQAADTEDGPGGMMMSQPQMGGMMGGGGMGGGMMGAMGLGRNTPAMLTAQREFQNRVQIAQLSAALAASDRSPKSQAVMTKLDQPLKMAFANETPLENVLKYIRSATAGPNGTPIPIYVDPKGLQQVERTLNSTVTIDLEGVPLKMSLRLLLKQLDLAYCVRDGVLIISSVQGVREELAEAASEMLGSDPKQLEGIFQSMGIGGGGMGMM